MRGKPIPYRQAAAVAGVSSATLMRAEAAKAIPDMHNFLRLCNWMGREPAWYFTL